MKNRRSLFLLIALCVSAAIGLLWWRNTELRQKRIVELERIEQETLQAKLDELVADGQIFIESLREKIGGYPPSLEEDELNATIADAKNMIDSRIEFMTKNGDDSVLLWQICEVYRLLYNTDEPESFENARKYCQKSAILNETDARPYISEGLLLVNANISLAADAEILFLKGKEQAKDEFEKTATAQGLAYAYYYQVKIEELTTLVKEWKKEYPNNHALDSFERILKEKYKLSL